MNNKEIPRNGTTGKPNARPPNGQEKLVALKERAARELKTSSLLDDVYMSAFFDGFPEGVELVLQIILEKDDLHVIESRVQHVLTTPGCHGARLDVFAEDSAHKLYDIEFQNAPDEAVPQRARYYSAMLDTRALKAGEDYTELRETYVIFVTATDIFRRGKVLYRFERVDAESGEAFGDGAHILYLNTSRPESGTKLGALIHDIRCEKSAEMVYSVLKDRAKWIKAETRTVAEGGKAQDSATQKGGNDMGLLDEAWEIGKEEGLLRGREENQNRMIAAMLRRNMTVEDIADIAGMTTEEVLAVGEAIGAVAR